MRFAILAVLVLLAGVAAASACGGDDDGAADEGAPAETAVAPDASPISTEAPEPTTAPTPPQPSCDRDPSYPDANPCIPIGAADYDCLGGTGDGPNFIAGPITVLPPDPHGLDGDGDGIGCES